ncbi:MAG: DUF4843 domain-containing protein [Bacteroides sp.]|nr:DUF4843 domain-containing protein [Bacteroides sp.]
MKKIYQGVCVVTLAASLLACTNEDYKLYDVNQKDAVFFEYIDEKEEIATSVDYNFNYNIDNTYTVELPVKLMGMPVDYEREIKWTTAEGTDMVEGTHFQIEGNVIPANEVATTLKVILLRDKDPEALQERSLKLVLSLAENDDLRAVGQTEFTITYSDIRPDERPAWWSEWSPLPVYSFEAAQVFFKYFYEYAPVANSDVFNAMIEKYGDYFVNAASSMGPFAMYSNFLKRYVLVPMYEDYKDEFEWQAIPSF